MKGISLPHQSLSQLTELLEEMSPEVDRTLSVIKSFTGESMMFQVTRCTSSVRKSEVILNSVEIRRTRII